MKANRQKAGVGNLVLTGGLAVAVFLGVTQDAGAWDRKRHRIIERRAARLLAPAARRALARYFKDPASLDTGIKPDALKKKAQGRCSAQLHYVNPDGRAYANHRPAKRGDAVRVLVLLEDRLRVLVRDPKSDAGETKLALGLWIHIASDLSQPLHSGYSCDRGGNSRRIIGAGRVRNLHTLWDGKLLDLFERAGGSVPTDSPGRVAPGNPSPDLDYAHWSSESAARVPLAYGCAHGAGHCAICSQSAPPIRINATYLASNGPLLASALMTAAHRVARGLEAIVSGRERALSERQLRARLISLPGGAAVRRCFERLKKL